MAIDPSIALQVQPVQIPDQVAQYGRLLQLKGLQGQQRLQDLQLKSAEDSSAENEALKKTLQGVQPDAQGNYDLKSLAPQLMAVSPTGGAALVKNFGELNKQQTEQRKTQLESALKQLDFIGQVASGVTDQASYDQAKGILQQSGVDTAQMPANYDPNAVKMNQMRALSIKDRLTQEHNALTLAETQRHNQVSEGNQAADTKLREQDINLRKDQLDAGKTPAGYRRGANGTLEFIPGGPADPNNKATGVASEDERKGAGWFNQANKAFVDMQDALKIDPNAQKPGVIESLPYQPAVIKNVSRSDARQKYVQGASAFSEAVLRAATGAGVNRDEALQKVTEITPQWGDSDAVITQKTESMKSYLNSLQQRGGRALPRDTVNAGQATPNPIDDLVNKYAD